MKMILRGFTKGFQRIGHNITIIVNTTLLFIVYVFGVGISWVLIRTFGKHQLELKQHNGETYWHDLHLGKKKMEEYYKQF